MMGRQAGRQAGKHHWRVLHDTELNLAPSQSKSRGLYTALLAKELQLWLIGGRSCRRERQTGHRDPAATADLWVWHRQSCDYDNIPDFWGYKKYKTTLYGLQ